MPARDLGNKFVCFKCGTKFYDLKKPDPVCPKCGTDQREVQATRPAETRRGRFAAVPKVIEPVVEPAVETPAAEEEIEEFEDEEEDEAVAATEEEET